MLQKGAAFLKHPHLALPLAAGLRHSGSAQRVFCGFRTANSVRLKKTVPNQRFGTVFLLFLGFFGGAEGLQALLDEVGDGAAADAVVKVVALEVEIRGVVVLIADGLKDFREGARLHDLAEGVDVLDALARDVLDAQTAAVVRHQPALAAELLDGEADGNTAHAVFHGELALGAIGVLCHEKIWFPTLPGNVMNAWTYNFPVQFQFLREVDNKMIFAGEKVAYERILEGCKELKKYGVRAVTGACGFFGHYQKRLAAKLDIPVALSSLVQLPWIAATLKKVILSARRRRSSASAWRRRSGCL